MLPTTTTAPVLLLLVLAQLCQHATAPPTNPNNLRVAVLNAKPFSFLDTENAQSDDEAEYSGLFIDLFKEIAGQLDLSYEFYQVPDGKYGTQDENGKWQGLIGELVNGNADIAVAPLTITPNRAKVVRFGWPIVPAGIVPIVKRPPGGQPLPFSTIEELVSKTDLLYGSVKDGATYQFFSNAPNGSVHAFIGQQMNARSDEVMARSYEEGIKRVREGGYVFFGEQYSLELMASRAPCNLMVVGGNPLTLRHYAFAFRKDATELTDKFDQALLEQEWDVNRLIKKYWEPQCARPDICMCDRSRPKDPFTKEPSDVDSKEAAKPQESVKHGDDSEEEERKEDMSANEEKAAEKTEQAEQVVPDNQEQPETTTAASENESTTVAEQAATEAVTSETTAAAATEAAVEEKDEEVTTTLKPQPLPTDSVATDQQDENTTEAPTTDQEDTDETEQEGENAGDDANTSTAKDETTADL